MAENSHISWTHGTFNPWWGCTKVSPACDFCYAERDSKRYGFDIFGSDARRRFFGDKHWEPPLKWNAKEAASGEPFRVFRASMSDVFEKLPKDHPDTEQMDGVLNSAAYHEAHKWVDCPHKEHGIERSAYRLDPACVERLNTIITATGATVVISSSWRDYGLRKCRAILRAAGYRGTVHSITPVRQEKLTSGLVVSSSRWHEIWSWIHNTTLLMNPDHGRFVALDDDDLGTCPWQVRTNFHIGLTDEDASAAIAILIRDMSV